MLNLDTHILLFALGGTLQPREERILAGTRWSISAIVLWEIAKLSQLGRIAVDLHDPVFEQVFQRLHVWPVDREVCHSIARLDFRGDPADELIAATSLVHNVPLLTRDRKILRSKLTPLVR